MDIFLFHNDNVSSTFVLLIILLFCAKNNFSKIVQFSRAFEGMTEKSRETKFPTL